MSNDINLNLETSDQVYILSLDILGFTTLVEKNSHLRLVNLFELFINTWIADLNLINKNFLSKINGIETEKIKSLFISDTILMFSFTAKIENFLKLVLLTQIILANSFKLGIPLRGCITSGQLTVKHLQNNDLIFGRPIIDTYLHEKKQEWAGCCITERCIRTTERFSGNPETSYIDTLIQKNDIFLYNVPLKDNLFEQMYVINWTSIAKDILKIDSKDIYDSFFMHRKEPRNEDELNKTRLKIANTIRFWKESIS